MTSAPYLIVDDAESGNWKYRLSWYLPEDGDIGGSVGDSSYTEIDLKTLAASDVDSAIAYLAVAKLNGIQRDASGFFWDTRSAAQSALRVAKAAIKAGVDRPIPDLARQALAAKWTPPKGFNAAARIETEESVLAELDQLEAKLAAELGMKPRTVRRQLVRLLRAGEVAETALVARWLAAYHAAMEYAAESAAGPPRDLHQKPEQGVEVVKMSIELHIGCGGVVLLVHEVWRCAKCGVSPIPVTEIDLITGKAAEERTEEECPDCRCIAEEDGDILSPVRFAHGGPPEVPR